MNHNLNFPLKENITGHEYHGILMNALKSIKKFNPQYLIICLGFDTAKGDPTGTWMLSANDFRKNGEILGSLPYPVLFIQEGGYRNRSLGINARNFFEGFWKSKFNTDS